MKPVRSFFAMTAWLLALAMTAPSAALLAHDNATLDAMPSPHGGQVRMAGAYHIELVLEKGGAKKRRSVLIYLQNHAFQGVSSAGTSATVTIKMGGGSITVALKPDGPESLRGSAVYGMQPGLTASVTFTTGDGQLLSAAYTPYAPAAAR